MNRFSLLAHTFLTYSNPLKTILSRLGLLKGIQKVRMRNGQEFLIRAGTTDISVLNEIYINKIYDEAIMHRPLAPTIIDIGANIGAFSVRAVSLCHRPKIYAFEPYSQNFQLLQKNIGLNNLQGTIFSFKKAVSQSGKSVKLNIENTKEGASSMYSDASSTYQSHEKADSIRLSDFIDERGLKFIDLLKLDCEGAEFEILYGLGKKHLRMMKRIVLEYHEYFGTGKARELKKHLERNGFKVRLNYTGQLGMMLAER